MEEKIAEKKTVVLRFQVAKDEVKKIVDKKKVDLFGSRLRKPDPDEVHVDSLGLFYECYLILEGKLAVDFYRKAVHTINVDDVVTEVVIGDGIFQVKSESKVWKKFKSGMKAGIGMRKSPVDIELEEHVVIENEGNIALNLHGDDVEFPYEISAKTVENYPKKVLDANRKNVRKSEVKFEEAVARFSSKLMKEEKRDIRIVSETLFVDKADEVYVPVYEARCSGPDNKIAILRIDAITGKTI